MAIIITLGKVILNRKKYTLQLIYLISEVASKLRELNIYLNHLFYIFKLFFKKT